MYYQGIKAIFKPIITIISAFLALLSF